MVHCFQTGLDSVTHTARAWSLIPVRSELQSTENNKRPVTSQKVPPLRYPADRERLTGGTFIAAIDNRVE